LVITIFASPVLTSCGKTGFSTKWQKSANPAIKVC